MKDPRQLLHGLLDYIREQAKNINPHAFRLSTVPDKVLRPRELAGLPGVELDLKVEGDHVWLRVERLEADKPPAVPERYRDLFSVSSDPNGVPPTLDEARFLARLNASSKDKTTEERADLERRGREAAAQSLATYIELWQAWAAGERPRRQTISLYGDLFALKHQLEAEETSRPQELVWGVGVSTWQLKDESGAGVTFEYPLLTQVVEITLDEETMRLEVRPRAVDTRVELDAFVACNVQGATDVERAMKEQLARHRDRPVTPFDSSSFTDILKLAATNLDAKGRYAEVLAGNGEVPAASEFLAVTDAWVLLSRPRSNNYLFEDLKRLQEKLDSGCEIPVGPVALVTPASDDPVEYESIRFRGLSSRGEASATKPVELFFPLPYNTEQVTIVQRLEKAPGVAVQGPPGTGKSHTIANIIAHYLATGRKVLVTSKGEPALEVLQSKIPEEIRPLTVALLANDREGVRQFQAAIEAIQHQVSQLNPEETKRQIETLLEAIDRAHTELAMIDRRVDEIALAQLSEVQIDGVPMRAQKLAELVVRGAREHAWFPDKLSLAPEHQPPLTDAEANTLREVRRTLKEDLIYADARVPSADALPSAADIGKLHDVLTRMKAIDGQIERGEVLDLKAVSPEVLQAARRLLQNIDEAITLLTELETFDGGQWPLELRLKCRAASFAAERQALEALFSDIDGLMRARAGFLKRPIEMPNSILSAPKALEAIARAAETGKPFGVMAFGAGEAKAQLAAVKVAGLPPSDATDWAHVHQFVLVHQQVVSFVARWNQFADALGVPRMQGGIDQLRRLEGIAVVARKAHRLGTQYDAMLPAMARDVFENPPAKALLGISADLEQVKVQLLRHLTRAELAQAAVALATFQEKLAGCAGPVSDSLRAFIAGELGNGSASSERVVARYAELIAELRRIAGLSYELSVVKECARCFAEAGAPTLAERIRREAVNALGSDQAFPPDWREAWTWARMRSYLESIEAREELVTLAARRRGLEEGLSRLYKEMVGKAAWLATKRNATAKVLHALAGYATAIRRIGQGTGPNAWRYRRDARQAMLDAAGAVPCWIMSHARISESMPADIGAFDLVIVDEASQSNLWALPAILRGTKILVVGDDKQVSPDGSFISAQSIQQLKARFLADQPYGTEMTPEKSLYDLAARVFAAWQVMLREHFRCVPAIIAYSNRVFYKGAIQCIRIPKATERIDPPLVDVYVPDGMRDRRDCNRLEAEVIAEEITKLLADERFQGRTIGVVSLLGLEQAKLIDELVYKRCGAVELQRRRFVCGDARTFQGSERDIMFLSMVVDPSNAKALSGNMFEQRFNVGASRARDREYLVRSVNASDLSEKDLRLTLLAHFEKPLVVDKPDPDNLIDLCESGFERQVFTALVEAGYRVIPQVKSGAYRIDLVVEGTRGLRLAVECDGDEFHGPDRWQHDMARQRVLERAGWTFWRCFASTWTLHRGEVFDELLERLAAMGIEPIGSATSLAALVEKRVWKPTPTPGDQDEVQAVLESAVSPEGSVAATRG